MAIDCLYSVDTKVLFGDLPCGLPIRSRMDSVGRTLALCHVVPALRYRELCCSSPAVLCLPRPAFRDLLSTWMALLLLTVSFAFSGDPLPPSAAPRFHLQLLGHDQAGTRQGMKPAN